MKYRQLTKEQFENLHEEFALFLASQQIDIKEWKQLKLEKPEVAEEELNVFSDIVWEDVLEKTTYIAHFSKNTINLFKCFKKEMVRIVVKVTKDIDLNKEEDYKWLLQNTSDKSIELLTGKKTYTSDRNMEIFDLIEKGGHITKGELFEYFAKTIAK